MKRLIALLLASAMLLATAAGCAVKQNDTPTAAPAVTDDLYLICLTINILSS